MNYGLSEKCRNYIQTKHPLIQKFLEDLESGDIMPALLDFQIRKEIFDNISNVDINNEFSNNSCRIAINFCGRMYVLLVNSCGELFLVPKNVYDKL